MSELHGYMTPAQAARRLQVSVELVRSWLKSGKASCVVTPLGRLLPVDEVERLAVERQQKKSKGGRP